MEVGYLLLACLEIVITVWLCTKLSSCTKSTDNFTFEINNSIQEFYPMFKQTAKLLKTASKFSKAYKKFLEAKKDYKDLIKAYKVIKNTIDAFNFFSGKKKKKLNIFKIFRKIVFYF